MASYTKRFRGDYDHFVHFIEKSVIEGSYSSSVEDCQKTMMNGVQCTVLVFERYSYMGGNRVSMNLTILGYERDIQLFAITAGGSQALFFKINTIGENSFLDTLIEPVENYIRQYGDVI